MLAAPTLTNASRRSLIRHNNHPHQYTLMIAPGTLQYPPTLLATLTYADIYFSTTLPNTHQHPLTLTNTTLTFTCVRPVCQSLEPMACGSVVLVWKRIANMICHHCPSPQGPWRRSTAFEAVKSSHNLQICSLWGQFESLWGQNTGFYCATWVKRVQNNASLDFASIYCVRPLPQAS